MAPTSNPLSSLYRILVAFGFLAPGIWGLKYLFKAYASTSRSNIKGSKGSTSIPELKKLNDSVYIFYEPSIPRTGEVMFFHDIDWSEYTKPHVETWMSGNSSSICWPKDWLSSEFSEARITSVCYDSTVLKTNTTGHMDLHRIAENVWQDILEIYTENCPVFLVGHGVGGIVIKTVIRSMNDKLGWNLGNQGLIKAGLSSFLENIKGIFFYDSPFQGIRLANDTKAFPQGSSLLETLETLNANISRHNEWFRGWRRDRCTTAAISAALPTKVALGSYWFLQLVEESSARYDIDYFYTSASGHFGICKPLDKLESSFLKLVAFLDGEGLPRNSRPPTQIMESDIGACTVPSNDEPPVPREENAASACILLTTILNAVAELKQGHGVSQSVYFYLMIEHLEKIRQFPEMNRRLEEGLKKAGLKREEVNAQFELYSQDFIR